MKLALITDSSVYLPPEMKDNENLFVLDIPVVIDGETYVEGKNLDIQDFYQKMAASKNLPSTSQPSLSQLDSLLTELENAGYSHVLGLFLSSGISGFWQNIQYLIDEHPNLTIAFPDSKITSAPMGYMAETALSLADSGQSFETIVEKIAEQIEGTRAYIMVDDLNHLVKGGRLSNGSAMLGNLLSIKPILYFTEGRIEVFEKVRTEKKALKRLIEIVTKEMTNHAYKIWIIEANAASKAEDFRQQLRSSGFKESVDIVPFCGVISTHLGEGAIAVGFTPAV
ncbi:DegV family protein [Streptococcus dentiloxodontae]